MLTCSHTRQQISSLLQIWRSTTALGCTNAVCGDQRGVVVVCQMWPQGNVVGNVGLWELNVPRPLQAPQTAG